MYFCQKLDYLVMCNFDFAYFIGPVSQAQSPSHGLVPGEDQPASRHVECEARSDDHRRAYERQDPGLQHPGRDAVHLGRHEGARAARVQGGVHHHQPQEHHHGAVVRVFRPRHPRVE